MFALTLLLLWVCALQRSNGLAAAGPRTRRDADLFELSIIHYNDFHARFEQTNWNSGACAQGSESTCVGGFPRIYTQVNKLLKERPNPILLNAGDNFQGTLWYTLHRWNATVTFMNKIPIDATTLGNHEFDNKIAGVVPYLENLRSPVVVCNIDDSQEPAIQGKYQKSLVIERAGRKIGIVGVITNTTSDISSSEKLVFLSHVDSVASEAAKLKSQGVNIIIVLSHVGLDSDRDMAAAIPDIDVIVGGHSHSLLYTGTPPGGDVAEDVYPTLVRQPSGRTVAIVQAGAYSKYMGNLTAWFDSDGELVSAEGNPILLDSSVQQDPQILQDFVPWKEAIDQLGEKVVGRTKVMLDATNSACTKGECNIGNMLTDAMVEEYVQRAEEGSWTYAAIAFTNSGGIRTSIEKTNNGDISYNDLVTCQPFENTIDTGELLGSHLLAALEKSVSDERWKKNKEAEFRGFGFLQLSGIHVTYDVGRPIGERVVNVSVLCRECRVPKYEPLDLNKWYRIIVSSFLANGGDAYHVIQDNLRNYTQGRLDIDIFVDYMKKNSPLINGLDERITIIQAKS